MRLEKQESSTGSCGARVLNRILRITEQGWEYEPDQRHAEMIVEQLGLKDAKAVETPTEEEKKWEREEDDKELDADKQKALQKYRGAL